MTLRLVYLQDEESLKLEIQELEQSIETTQGQIVSCVEVIAQYQEQEKTLVDEVAECKVGVGGRHVYCVGLMGCESPPLSIMYPNLFFFSFFFSLLFSLMG